jgi:glyoxylase-like metal-dependent hydrolase (beta-lactamase superfamily II)
MIILITGASHTGKTLLAQKLLKKYQLPYLSMESSEKRISPLGERKVDVIHTPGHAPGYMCFWETGRDYLFTGDLAYKGMLAV